MGNNWQDSTFWSLRQMLYYWVRCEKLLAVQHFIFFLQILQKLSNILHPSRQNWTTEVCFFLQKENNSWKYLSQLLLTSYFILVCLNEKKTVHSFYNSSMDSYHEFYHPLLIIFAWFWRHTSWTFKTTI